VPEQAKNKRGYASCFIRSACISDAKKIEVRKERMKKKRESKKKSDSRLR